MHAHVHLRFTCIHDEPLHYAGTHTCVCAFTLYLLYLAHAHTHTKRTVTFEPFDCAFTLYLLYLALYLAQNILFVESVSLIC